ncbi:MAG: hypothetical protein NC223_03235 [Butyrivibrio sp.]|nr:hypothetical protein [Butyrivibrio sp.]
MIIYPDGGYERCSEHPDTLYDENAKYCIPDSSELAAKYAALYPRAQPVTDDSGNVVDIVELPKTEAEAAAEKRAAYESLSVAHIRERYSQNDENKIIREYLADPTDRTEFDAYNAYVTECKARAKTEIYGEEV